MKFTLVVMPASPALVPELAPRDQAGQRLLSVIREAISGETAIELVGSRDDSLYTRHAGSFAAWGAPQVTVGEGNYLPELVQRYAIGSSAEVTDVRDQLGDVNPEALTLVAVDGSAGMTPRAPMSLLPAAGEADAWCRAILTGQQPGDLPEESGIIDVGLWKALAGVEKQNAALLDADSSLGVARYVAGWTL